MQARSILVPALGATGKTGARVAHRLEARGLPVRRGSRRGAPPFDWTAPGTWGPAISGVGAVCVSFCPDIGVPGAVETIEAFTAEARAAGADRLALPTGRGERHARREEAVVRRSGLAFAILRAAWFAQHFSEGALHGAVTGGAPMPGGAVREPIVEVEDIAEAAVAALTGPGHDGALHEPTGPRPTGFAEMAEALSHAIGRPVVHAPISYEAFQAGPPVAQGPMIAEVLTAIVRESPDGRRAMSSFSRPRPPARAPGMRRPERGPGSKGDAGRPRSSGSPSGPRGVPPSAWASPSRSRRGGAGGLRRRRRRRSGGRGAARSSRDRRVGAWRGSPRGPWALVFLAFACGRDAFRLAAWRGAAARGAASPWPRRSASDAAGRCAGEGRRRRIPKHRRPAPRELRGAKCNGFPKSRGGGRFRP